MIPEKSATIADMHLRTHVWSSRPTLKNDAIYAMEDFFDYCLENRCSAKILGDTFHTLTPLPEFVKPLFDKLSKMEETGLPVYYIQGNHDLNNVPWLSLHPWPVNIDGEIINLPETNMTLMGKQSCGRDELLELFDNVPSEVNTLLLHQAEAKALPFSPQFELREVPEHIQTVLIGDIHKPQDYTAGNTHLWYPGSPYVTEIDNTDQRSFLVESLDAEGELIIERVPIPGRNFYHTCIDPNTKDIDLGVEAVESQLKEISENDSRHHGLQPVVIIEYPSKYSEQCYQHFLMCRAKYDIYTWLSIEGELSDENRMRVSNNTDGDVDMDSIIDENVFQEIPREILKKIFRGNDVGETLRDGLDKVISAGAVVMS